MTIKIGPDGMRFLCNWQSREGVLETEDVHFIIDGANFIVRYDGRNHAYWSETYDGGGEIEFEDHKGRENILAFVARRWKLEKLPQYSGEHDRDYLLRIGVEVVFLDVYEVHEGFRYLEGVYHD
jgi:hypothetical protein